MPRFPASAGLALAILACSRNPAPTAGAPAAPAVAAPAPIPPPMDLAGNWDGSITLGGETMPVALRMSRGAAGYTGDVGVQGGTLAVRGVSVRGDTVAFTVDAPDGEAFFEGTLSADRRQLSGMILYQGQVIPFTAQRRE